MYKEIVLDLLSLHVSRLLVTRELKTRLLQLLETEMVGCAVFVKFCRAKSCFSLSLSVKSLGRACLSAQELRDFPTFVCVRHRKVNVLSATDTRYAKGPNNGIAREL